MWKINYHKFQWVIIVFPIRLFGVHPFPDPLIQRCYFFTQPSSCHPPGAKLLGREKKPATYCSINGLEFHGFLQTMVWSTPYALWLSSKRTHIAGNNMEQPTSCDYLVDYIHLIQSVESWILAAWLRKIKPSTHKKCVRSCPTMNGVGVVLSWFL